MTKIVDIPDDCLFVTFSFLSLSEIIKIREVNRMFYEIAKEAFLWNKSLKTRNLKIEIKRLSEDYKINYNLFFELFNENEKGVNFEIFLKILKRAKYVKYKETKLKCFIGYFWGITIILRIIVCWFPLLCIFMIIIFIKYLFGKNCYLELLMVLCFPDVFYFIYKLLDTEEFDDNDV